jgi:hypothetical protein
MSTPPERERFSLKRWSQRKHAVARDAASPVPATAPETVAPPVDNEAASPAAPAAATPEPPPPVESLTFDADFTAFMKPDVDPSLRRAALKKLFADPRFNVMDGLDVYIDDYSKPDPIDPSIVAQLVQARYLFDPPKTRINERGEVEDVPPETAAAAAAADVPGAADAVPALPDGVAAAPPSEPPMAAAAATIEPPERKTT